MRDTEQNQQVEMRRWTEETGKLNYILDFTGREEPDGKYWLKETILHLPF
jgi:hypothetical protein